MRKILIAILTCAAVALAAAGCGQAPASSAADSGAEVSSSESSSEASSSEASSSEASSSEASSSEEASSEESSSEEASSQEESAGGEEAAEGDVYTGSNASFAIPEGYTVDDSNAPQIKVVKEGAAATDPFYMVMVQNGTGAAPKEITDTDLKDLEEMGVQQLNGQGSVLKVEKCEGFDYPTAALYLQVSGAGGTVNQVQYLQFADDQMIACYYTASEELFDGGLSDALAFAQSVKGV